MKITILCRALRSLIVALVPATGAMTQPNETTYGQLPDIPPQKEPHTKVQPIRVGFVSEWLFITLPRPGYESLAASKNGVVLLRKQDGDRQFHRWKAGETLLLTQDTDASRLLPGAAYRFINYAFSAAGAIAVAYGASDTREPIGGIKYFFRDEYINVWSANSNTAKLVQGNVQVWSDSDTGESYSAHSYQRYSRLLTIDSPIGEWSEYVTGWFTTSGEGYKLMRVTAPITSITGSESKTLFASDVVRTGANSSGDFIGYRRANPVGIVAGLINQETVDFAPAFISENGIVLGRTNSMNEASYSAFVPTDQAEVMYSYPLRRSIPLPTDGRVTWVDELDRPNGYAPDGTPAVWTPVKGANGAPLLPLQYVRQSYIPLPVPRDPAITNPADDWQINPPHLIPPNTEKNQLGIMRRGQVTQPFLAIRGGLYVDANRDGTLATDGSDPTSAETPFRFWLNDDIDRKGVDPDEPDVEDDDDPASRSNDRDWMRDQIPGKRDLEDFARLWVYTQGLNSAFKSGEMKLGLKWGNVTSGAPAIKLYRAADTDGGTGYLFDPTVAQSQIDPANAGKAITMMPQGGGAATTVIEGANGFFFPKEVFANLTDALPKMYLLFEGCKKGTGQLQLVVYDKNGTKIGEGPGLHLDLKNIKELYERWTVGDGPNPLIGQKGGGDPGTRATISSDRLPSEVTALQYGPQQTSDDKNYILFVHGWNVAPWLKDAWAETTFKRLYWQGYKGRFGAFQWPTTYHDWSVVSVFDYDLGEYTAWRSAQPLADLLVNLNGSRSYTVSVLAHSMGNVVAGEALQVTGRTNRIDLVANYVATQAAVPGHCFDRSLTGGDLLTFGFLGFGSASTPNIYRDWFYLSSLVSRAQANFYNVNDYALSAQIWQLGQTLKPDKAFSVGGVWFGNGVWTGTAPNQVGPSYGYSGDPTAAPAKTGFFKTKYGSDANGAQIITGTSPLNLEDVDSNNGSVTNLRDRYEIMAFASQPRSKALGGVAAVAGFAPQNLGSLWKPDTFPQTNGPYSAHPWHSAQFRFTNADQANYWNKFMKKLGLPTTQ